MILSVAVLVVYLFIILAMPRIFRNHRKVKVHLFFMYLAMLNATLFQATVVVYYAGVELSTPVFLNHWSNWVALHIGVTVAGIILAHWGDSHVR